MKTNRSSWKLELHETVHWSWRNHRIHRSLQIFTNHPYVYGHLSWFHMISYDFYEFQMASHHHHRPGSCSAHCPHRPHRSRGGYFLAAWSNNTGIWWWDMMGYKHALGGVDTLEIVLGRIPHSYNIYIYIWTYLDESYSHLCTFEPSRAISDLFWTCYSLCGWVV